MQSRDVTEPEPVRRFRVHVHAAHRLKTHGPPTRPDRAFPCAGGATTTWRCVAPTTPEHPRTKNLLQFTSYCLTVLHMATSSITLRIDEDLKTRLHKFVALKSLADEPTTTSEVVRIAVTAYLDGFSEAFKQKVKASL